MHSSNNLKNVVGAELPPEYILVKPCEYYQKEYKYCKRIKSRYQQLYIDGKFDDCTKYWTDFKNCEQWLNNANKDNLNELLRSEKERMLKRIYNANKNDIWEARTSFPPDAWNKPLPDYYKRKTDESIIVISKEETIK